MYCTICGGSGLSRGTTIRQGVVCGACNGSGRARRSPNAGSTAPPRRTARPARVNLTGSWHGSDQLAYRLSQFGPRLTVTAINPLNGQILVQGQGVVQGGRISVSYSSIGGLYGTAEGVVFNDGRSLSLTTHNSVTGRSAALTLTR